MTNLSLEQRQVLREKHSEDEKNQCSYCLYEKSPCDVIKVLDALDEAERRAVANYERGYDDGYKGSVADAEWDHWCDGVNDDQP